MSKWHYVYYSYEPWGRGYIGKRSSNVPPEEDHYMGSFTDKSFRPTEKIVLATFENSHAAIEAEIQLHNFYNVDINPCFANRARQTSTGFAWHGNVESVLSSLEISERRRKLALGNSSGTRGFFWCLTSPTGATHVTINLNAFCRDHDLSRGNIQAVAEGKRSHHKGWKAVRMVKNEIN